MKAVPFYGSRENFFELTKKLRVKRKMSITYPSNWTGGKNSG